MTMTFEIVRLPELIKRIGLSRSSIYARINTDPTFPQPLSLGGRSVGWISEEVDAWLEHRAADRTSRKGLLVR
jgi:prophage regulatory protein